MSEASRAATIADLKALISSLNEAGAPYLLIGGYALAAHAETIELDGVPVRTVNLEGLLRTKQGAREKDIADRLVLEAALRRARQGD